MPRNATTPNELSGTTWLVEDLGGQGVVDRVRSTLAFDGERVSGRGGCNQFHGGLAASDTPLLFGPMASTRMACPEAVMDQENRYFMALGKATAIERDADRGLLYLLDASGEELARLSLTDPE